MQKRILPSTLCISSEMYNWNVLKTHSKIQNTEVYEILEKQDNLQPVNLLKYLRSSAKAKCTHKQIQKA